MDYIFLGNSVSQWLMSLLIFLVVIFAVMLSRDILIPRLKKITSKTETEIDDFLLSVIERRFYPYLFFFAFYLAVRNLKISAELSKGLGIANKVAFSLLIISVVSSLAAYLFRQYMAKKDEGAINTLKFSGFMTIIQSIIWGFGTILVLDNLGIKISALVAGLGIGGVAMALASQAVLKDLFSYFSILFDKPFEMGDFVITGDYLGVIEKIGIKTTRIRSLWGEELVFSNTDLIERPLKNYKRMAKRRVAINLGIVYETTLEKTKLVPALIKEAIESTPQTVFDRAHFREYGDFSLKYEAIYYVPGPDYNTFMDIQQEINFKIKEAFEKNNIVFAYPTQLVYINKN